MSFKNIPVTEFKNKIETESNAVILDVRSEAELNEGSIPNHILIDFMKPDFTNKVTELDRDKTYLVYCRSGNRSGKTCAMMAQMGFTKLYNLDGGIMAWNALS
ncbi:MAG TPA: rhodanese-like domain-containing protein [Microscillaceae bacterium]|nr:rhodanese-like domain-containing protein [Microscillaceae bacterium]